MIQVTPNQVDEADKIKAKASDTKVSKAQEANKKLILKVALHALKISMLFHGK